MFLGICGIKSVIDIIYNDKRKVEMASTQVFIEHINDWNEVTRKSYLKDHKGAPDYREIRVDRNGFGLVDNPIRSCVYVLEYKPCGGSRMARIHFLDCGAMVFTEKTYNMDYAEQWGFDGIIPYSLLVKYITDIDTIDVGDFSLTAEKTKHWQLS